MGVMGCESKHELTKTGRISGGEMEVFGQKGSTQTAETEKVQ